MTISDIYFLIIAMLVGIGMGIFYFGGLWLTVKHIANAQGKIFLVMGSFLARNAFCAVILWLLARGGHWQRVLVCLLGFVIARTFLVRRLRISER